MRRPIKVLDLFSGIGGFSLGLERTGGFQTVAFCEIDPYCRRVLAKHWPAVKQYEDIRDLTGDRLRADGISVDAICGGFPCTDISFAGKGAGINGSQSGLWREYARLVDELRPPFVLVENTAALLGRGLDRVLGDLAALGYDSEWHCVQSTDVGAPHLRDRVWLVAYPMCHRHVQSPDSKTAAHHQERNVEAPERRGSSVSSAANPGSPILAWNIHRCSDWMVEPDVGRVAYGVPDRVDRLRALGNAVVPQIPELIGRAILHSLEDA